ncbi:hypothetical protein, partial [Streptococcus dysgalactiae]|uniref:hypothetical protein n=1 Tax=Streptococcus dysgalactiae TaxID=1334 RepID=UPI00194DEE5C
MAESSKAIIDGHYQIGLPWRHNKTLFPDNRILAERRLACLKRLLLRDEHLRTKYSAVIQSHIKRGYVSKVNTTKEEVVGRWYLPHHPVLNINKPGKVRVVFDCAAEFRGTSLNKVLLQGPNINNSLLGVLLRFRKHEVAVSADVEEMFLQVRVPITDRRALSFLWWDSELLEGRPNILELNVHPFGATSYPCCVSFALRQTALDNAESFSTQSVSAITENFHVDDCLVSTETVGDAKRIVTELRRLLHLGGFHITKWISNRPEVIEDMQVTERWCKVKAL